MKFYILIIKKSYWNFFSYW